MSPMDALKPCPFPTNYVCLAGLCTPAEYTVLTREYYMNIENEVAREVQSVLLQGGGIVLSGPYTVKGHVVIELNEVAVAERVRKHFSGRAYKGVPIRVSYLMEPGYMCLTYGLKRKSKLIAQRRAQQASAPSVSGDENNSGSDVQNERRSKKRSRKKARKKYRKKRRHRSKSQSDRSFSSRSVSRDSSPRRYSESRSPIREGKSSYKSGRSEHEERTKELIR